MGMVQRGNALFLILLGIVLLGALTHAVTASMRGGGKDASPERISTDLSEVQQYATLLSDTIQELKISNDCLETQINFDNSVVPSYTNPDAPSDNSCDIFSSAGGPIPWQEPPGYIFPKADTGFWRTSYAFTGQVAIPNLGTGKADLLLTMEVKDAAQCAAINQSIDGSAATPLVSYCFEPFYGVYDNTAGCNIQTWTNVGGKSQYCVSAGSNQYYYYNVLLVR